MIFDTFTLERTYDSSVEHLYEAWADPTLKYKWFGGGDEWKPTERSFDFRVGGIEVDAGTHTSGLRSRFVARYHVIAPNERIVLAYDMYVNEQLISVTLATAEFGRTGRSATLRYTEQSVYFDTKFGPDSRKAGTEQLFDQLSRAL